MTIQRINPQPRWSDAVIWQHTLYYTAVPENLEHTDIHQQTSEVLQQIEEMLQAYGSNKSRLLDVTIFLVDAADIAAFNQHWDNWLPPAQAPVRCAVQTALMDSRYRLEIKLIAAV